MYLPDKYLPCYVGQIIDIDGYPYKINAILRITKSVDRTGLIKDFVNQNNLYDKKGLIVEADFEPILKEIKPIN